LLKIGVAELKPLYENKKPYESEQIIVIELKDSLKYVHIMGKLMKKQSEELMKKQAEEYERKLAITEAAINKLKDEKIAELEKKAQMNQEENFNIHKSMFDAMLYKSMRKEKCRDLFKRLDSARVLLVKSSPFSGKTSLAFCFKQYLNDCQIKNAYIDPCSIASQTPTKIIFNIDKDFENAIGMSPQALIDNSKVSDPPFIVIVDEAQTIYNNENFIFLLKRLRDMKESQLLMILFASYGENPYYIAKTPLDLKKDALSSKYIKFDKSEVQELFTSFIQNHPDANKILVDQELIGLITILTDRHPGLMTTCINSLVDTFKNLPETKNFETYHKYFHSRSFFNKVLNTRAIPKAPEILQAKDTPMETFVLKLLFYHEQMQFGKEEEKDAAKSLEKKGFLVEEDSVYSFTSPIIESVLYEQILRSQQSEDVEITKNTDGTYTPSIKEICYKALTKMNFNILIGIENAANERLKEASWNFEFYRALTSVINIIKHPISPENSKNVKKGRIDFYINGEIHWGIETFIEDNKIGEHCGRFDKDEKYGVFEENQYVVMNFRQKTANFSENKFKEFDNLIRVCYDFNEKSFTFVENKKITGRFQNGIFEKTKHYKV